uniref:Glycine N-acyltransferase-like protein n=1 Tax=Lepisosteus oculatus TaxID=7918 RepID=W5LVB7_LEPOC
MICVDSWPNFNTVICRRQNKVQDDKREDLHNWFLCFFYLTVRIWSFSQIQHKCIHDNTVQSFFKKGIPHTYCDLIKEVATSSGMDVKEFKDYSLMVNHNPEITYRRDLALKISSLQVSHAELLVKHTANRGSDLTLSHVRSCIQHLPSACILDDSGNPVSWCLSDELCEMRMGFTLPEYRRTGHMKTVLLALSKQMHAMGFPVYGHVAEGNTAAINMFKSLNSTFIPGKYAVQIL